MANKDYSRDRKDKMEEVTMKVKNGLTVDNGETMGWIMGRSFGSGNKHETSNQG